MQWERQSTLSLTSLNSALDGVGGHRHAPAALSLGKRQETGWTPVPVWTGREDHRHRNSIPVLSNPQRGAVATTKSRPVHILK